MNVSWKAPLEENQKRIDLYNMDNTLGDIRNDKHMQVTANRIKKHEGKEYTPYQLEYKGNMDSKVKENFYTVGYGHKITG